MQLSVIIPARNEIFLNRTIEEVLSKSRADTECIVILDGAWGEALPQHERLTVIYHPYSVGQRAAINEGARVSKATYIMKLDAHCTLDEGYDVKLMEAAKELGREVTQVPLQYNLHAFDWVCPDGHRRYQSPSGPCKECGKETARDIVWKKRDSRKTWAWRFDSDLHFQYWHEYEKKHPEDFVETMSLLGACFFMERERYWELGGSDEEHHGWGQQGVEIACKSWLSGGKVITNKRTWFSHMFRTQGGDFSFPYEMKNSDVEKSRRRSRELWRENKWPLAKRDLSWLINKFNPPTWSNKEIIYYTDNRLKWSIAKACRKQLLKAGLPIISVSLKKADLGKNIIFKGERSKLTMLKQILTGLENATADIIFLCEHDVLYHPSHFDFIPPDKNNFYFNTNVWKVRAEDGFAITYDDMIQVSGMCAYRETLLDFYRKQVENFNGHYEPTERRKTWRSKEPNVDIRHKSNLTPNRWKKEQFRKKPTGWVEASEVSYWGKLIF